MMITEYPQKKPWKSLVLKCINISHWYISQWSLNLVIDCYKVVILRKRNDNLMTNDSEAK